MRYSARFSGRDGELSVEREGLRLGSRFLDFADVKTLRPINHRVFISTLSDEEIEISMLGFSFDGFWEELTECFEKRSQEALFVEETPVMRCTDGEYQLPGEQGRGTVILLPDAISILPPDCHAVRIPLCFVKQLQLEGYLLHVSMLSGAEYTVGRMGYDTIPFAERAQQAMDRVKKQRARALEKVELCPPYTVRGLFRTEHPEQYWLAAFGKGCCAVELFTGENAATYLYRFSEPKEQFLLNLEEAMEAMGVHREIIFCEQEQIEANALYRMGVARSPAVGFLRARSAGRLIHTASHAQNLSEFLNA